MSQLQRRLLLLALLWTSRSIVSAGTTTGLIDVSGALRLQSISGQEASNGMVTIVTSPGTPRSSSLLLQAETESTVSSDITHCLWLAEQDDSTSPCLLICRGATLSATSDAERISLSTCSLVADSVILGGITLGDFQGGTAGAGGIRDSRHGRTLTALFRARIRLEGDSKNAADAAAAEGDATEDSEPVAAATTTKRQTLILPLPPSDDDDEINLEALKSEIESIFLDVSIEKDGGGAPTKAFDEMYTLELMSFADAGKIMMTASEAASKSTRRSALLASILVNAHNRVQASGIVSVGLDTPATARAFMTVINAHGKCLRTARAKFASWKARTVRGLWVDSFGAQAEALRKTLLESYDADTLMASGLTPVAAYRLELRTDLQTMIDTTLTQLYTSQIENCEKAILKKLNAQLLKTVNNDNVEESMDMNTAAMRKEAFHFETIATDLQVPTLGLTEEKAVREMAVKLNDALMTFPDSPEAKLKRTKKVDKTVKKEKKPGQRSVDLGVDLVAVLRPDGFGSLQGFCGYQLGGNSITLGIHNDADDPQTIAQFGGVRPPLLRVQPKLRIDVEL